MHRTSFAVLALAAMAGAFTLHAYFGRHPRPFPGPAAGTRSGAQFFWLGDLPGGDTEGTAAGLSADGRVAVGRNDSFGSADFPFGAGREAWRWTARTGMVGLGDFPAVPFGKYNSRAQACSADGTVVIGFGRGPGATRLPFRWTAASGMAPLDLPGPSGAGEALGVSSDGRVVVGRVEMSWGGNAFRWVAGSGAHLLGSLNGETGKSEACAVSADGSVVVGWSQSSTGPEAIRWTAAGGMVSLGRLMPQHSGSRAFALSADGSVVVGRSGGRRSRAFRWTEPTGMQDLGLLSNCDGAEARGVSANGQIVVGICRTEGRAFGFVWDARNGMRSVRDLLIDECGLGSAVAEWDQLTINAISADGLVVAGEADVTPHGAQQPWYARFPRQPDQLP